MIHKRMEYLKHSDLRNQESLTRTPKMFAEANTGATVKGQTQTKAEESVFTQKRAHLRPRVQTTKYARYSTTF